ncbi:ATP-dependent RNA helicase RhlE [Aquicella siphonis]|uniref:DEAD-box ATP-dependent RNA helicase RhpA n=1 Tax=Aquicella siphonis TaxID=254247 RepID=A0A5E4PJB6_9COXI|nr:DEAD/DEAH box helicase [Aquicella siphonis]VVC77169.1 ATP-dependent RNA helicase RhlE [Aquicella siphonis]
MSFDSFNLHPCVLNNIHALGYITPTPIQNQSIPPILSGKDVMGLAQTGTGKTAAFALPVVNRLLTGPRSCIRALVVAPTRELAQQINDAFVELCQGTGLRILTLYGGVNIKSQIKALENGVEIIVACPGRLLDHVQQKTINLSRVEMLVLDEADQMLDMGFLPSIRRILNHLPKSRQTLLFSATMAYNIDELAYEVLHNPVRVKIGNITPASSVRQALFPVASHLKSKLLIEILRKTDIESVLVFTRTKHGAKKVAKKLEEAGFRATSLQGNLSQNNRQRAMDGFRDGTIQILVATDIASRGIDVSKISHVINYDMPNTVEAYIHRIGRTGRADKTGEAYTLVTHEDDNEVRNIERVLGNRLEQCNLRDFDYSHA